MWLQLHGRLLTADKLMQWGITVDSRCCLCQNHDETEEHLFVECQFPKAVWQKILHWMQRQDVVRDYWDQHVQWVIQCAKGRSRGAQLYKMVYAEITHVMWIERNMKIFEKRSRGVDSIAQELPKKIDGPALPSLIPFNCSRSSADVSNADSPSTQIRNRKGEVYQFVSII
ncbi:PREDICTED: uncharacterized protein LOC109218508 [Nicotiana attenuata]|uniref:uncharacterized protein LOC109218508 n=1 Tax=Nicotiana attenuata TaxID=49451 RepID=UPI000904F5C6|nr:PREDICTED: uncharacterized protein LOC109218508 [Nicotiana attenuata]